jgi:NADPH-dependent ferric siderophore reductase
VLVIDFAIHEAGPATKWAIKAAPGDTLDIGGPRGSAVVPDDFDWYLLIGDETALPSIGRRTEELRAGVPVITAVVVDGADSEQVFDAKSAWQEPLGPP